MPEAAARIVATVWDLRARTALREAFRLHSSRRQQRTAIITILYWQVRRVPARSQATSLQCSLRRRAQRL